MEKQQLGESPFPGLEPSLTRTLWASGAGRVSATSAFENFPHPRGGGGLNAPLCWLSHPAASRPLEEEDSSLQREDWGKVPLPQASLLSLSVNRDENASVSSGA